MKLSKKTFATLLMSAVMATTLAACTSRKSYEEPRQEEVVEQSQENVQPPKGTEETQIRDNTESLGEADKTMYDYVDSLKETFHEIKNTASDKWNSPEFQEKWENFKQKVRNLRDFVFNGTEINGVTFEDLKDKTKEDIKGDVSELDVLIDSWFPDYKERLQNWFDEKKDTAYDWLVDKGADGIHFFEEFQTDVQENLNNKTTTQISRKR